MWKKIILNNIITDYSVSTEGEVKKDTTNYFLSQSIQQDYKFVSLLINCGSSKSFCLSSTRCIILSKSAFSS